MCIYEYAWLLRIHIIVTQTVHLRAFSTMYSVSELWTLNSHSENWVWGYSAQADGWSDEFNYIVCNDDFAEFTEQKKPQQLHLKELFELATSPVADQNVTTQPPRHR